MTKKSKLVIDSILALGALLTMVPQLLGITVHEWAGLVLGAFILFHIAINWKSIKNITLNFLHSVRLRTRFTYILNLLIFIGFAAIIFSGMYISKTIDFSWLGISQGGGRGWKLLHTSAAYLTFLLTGIHAGMNFRRVLYMIKPVAAMPRLTNQGIPSIARRFSAIVWLICILASGLYSLISLNYLSHANPVKIAEALQSLGQNNVGSLERGINSDAGQAPGSSSNEQYSEESDGKNEGRGPSGLQGPPDSATGQGQHGPPANSGRTRSPFVLVGNLLMFLGVFASAATVAYSVDRMLSVKRSGSGPLLA